jgi:hypothetical protein
MGYEFDMNDFHNEMNAILDNGKVPVDATGLRQAIETTQAEIREAVTNGDGEKLVDLDNRMRVLSARLFGADCSETKSAIDTAELEKISIGKEIEILRDIKKIKNLQAGRTEMLFQKRMEKVNQAELQIQFAESRLTNARVAAKESKARLQRLLDEKQREQASAYKKYELSRY